jgi:biopolymer transport protein ExbD
MQFYARRHRQAPAVIIVALIDILIVLLIFLMVTTVERLKEKVVAAVAKKPDLKLAISADKNAPIGQVIKVMDVAKETKLKTGVNLFTKEAPKP